MKSYESVQVKPGYLRAYCATIARGVAGLKSISIPWTRYFFGGKNLVEIGIDDFCAKVLCDNHNSSLSVLDTAVGLTFSTVEDLARDIFANATPGRGVTSFHISSGTDMERWLIKVYCGLVAAKKIRSASGRTLPRDALQPQLLESLLGTNSLPSPLGLYMRTFVGQQFKPGGISFSTIMLTDSSDEVGGLILSLGVMSFVSVTSMQYGQTYDDPNWHRHQTLVWNIRQRNSKISYLFTY
jgi:hypothetical protein